MQCFDGKSVRSLPTSWCTGGLLNVFPFVSGDSNGYEVFDRQQLGFKSLTNFKYKIKLMPIDIDKAKQALATLKEEKQAQEDRLQLAADTKRRVDAANAQHALAFSKRAL